MMKQKLAIGLPSHIGAKVSAPTKTVTPIPGSFIDNFKER